MTEKALVAGLPYAKNLDARLKVLVPALSPCFEILY